MLASSISSVVEVLTAHPPVDKVKFEAEEVNGQAKVVEIQKFK
jgi:hypothetical protein